MRDVPLKARLVARPQINDPGLGTYLIEAGAEDWFDGVLSDNGPDSQILAEFMGRLCYNSFSPGLNRNVTHIRTDREQYLDNLLRSSHGSVLEHANYSFVFTGVPRALTHELVRHRAGTAYSQESLRFVRLEDLPFRHPQWVLDDPELLAKAEAIIQQTEDFLKTAAQRARLDEIGTSFAEKKTITSDMRMYAPMGTLTTIGMTANVRALRHLIEVRTASSAMEEIRRLFGQVITIMQAEAPAFFGDFKATPVEGREPEWVPTYRKV